MPGSDEREPDGTQAIRALFEAHNGGRLEDLLRLLDPAVIWVPATRTGRNFYVGRQATIGPFTAIRRTYGDHRIECQHFEQIDDEQVRVTGSVIRSASDADPPTIGFTTIVTLLEGRIAKLVAEPGDLESPTPGNPNRAPTPPPGTLTFSSLPAGSPL